jgi:hypothetical protein
MSCSFAFGFMVGSMIVLTTKVLFPNLIRSIWLRSRTGYNGFMLDLKVLPQPVQAYWLKVRMRRNHGHIYKIFPGDAKDPRKSIQCLVCGGRSWSQGDVENLFCIRCGFYRDIERELYVPKENPYAG